MTSLYIFLVSWILDTAIKSGSLLLIGATAMGLARQPATRQRIGEWTFAGCLLIGALSAVPQIPRLPGRPKVQTRWLITLNNSSKWLRPGIAGRSLLGTGSVSWSATRMYINESKC